MASTTDDSMQVNSSDLIATKLVSNVFDGNGFTIWKRGMLIALSTKNKLGFVDGSNTKTDSKSSSFKAWQRFWDELEERFGQTNGAQLYGIHKKLNDFSQGNDSVSTCFTKIKQIWDEIDAMGMNPSCVCICACGAAEKQKKFQQDQRVVQFLMCLNDTYFVIRGAILMQNPLPSLGVVYNNLLQEERLREIQSSMSSFQTNSATFYAKGSKPYSSTAYNQNGSIYKGQIHNNSGNDTQFQGGEIKCNYCERLGHTIDKCRKLQYNNNKQRYANVAQYPDDADYGGLMEAFDSKVDTADVNQGVNNELCSQFLKFLKQQQQQKGMPNSDSSATANFAGTTADFAGNTSASNTFKFSNCVWIVDSGASDHMCSCLDLFSHTQTLPKPYTISMPNGHTVLIDTLETVMLTPDLCLKDVLFVTSSN
ncbi:hypothetical protein RND81_03G015100 [Saponaria officinalis]|uniref:Retrotransposon Copia-like N-terminal domain-containing protein n=1 Tax=Saponaria officinalis TaxID=3572 RepID=A0AAW1M0Q8_SAPOF